MELPGTFWEDTKVEKKDIKKESKRVETRTTDFKLRHGAAGGILPQEASKEAEEIRAGTVRRGTVSIAIRGQCQQSGNWPHLQSPQVHLQVKQLHLHVLVI